MRVTATLLSPLSHGAFGESAGNTVLVRRMAVVSLPGMPRVPAVSGNALRGVLRRAVFRSLFDFAGVSRETIPSPLWDRLYAALANGGHLDSSEGKVDPAAIRALRESLPPLSVFGASLYSWLLPGHMSVGIMWPRCRETLDAGLVLDAGKGGGGLGADDLVEELSHVRHVDRDMQDPELSGVTPMPVTVEVIATGAILESDIRFARHASEVEQSCVAWGLDRLSQLGGKGSAGLGRFSLEHDGDAGPYSAWLAETGAPALAERLTALAETFGTSKKKPKADKKGKGKAAQKGEA